MDSIEGIGYFEVRAESHVNMDRKFPSKNYISSRTGRIKHVAREQLKTTAPPPPKRAKTTQAKPITHSYVERFIGPKPTDQQALEAWKKKRQNLYNSSNRMLQEAVSDTKVHFFFETPSQDFSTSAMFEMVIPYHVMSSLLVSFKFEPTLSWIRDRMHYISNAKPNKYYPLYMDEKWEMIHWEDNDLLDNTAVAHLSSYFEKVATELTSHTKLQYNILPSYLETRQPFHQRAHLDDNKATNRAKEGCIYVLHIPLTIEGRVLRVWANQDKNYLVHTPFGNARMLRGDIFHAGCYGNPGNSGLAVKFEPKGSVISVSELGHMPGGTREEPPCSANESHGLAWDVTKRLSPGCSCPSLRYAACLREAHPYLFRQENDATLIAPHVSIEKKKDESVKKIGSLQKEVDDLRKKLHLLEKE
jgi:hypothetical protein